MNRTDVFYGMECTWKFSTKTVKLSWKYLWIVDISSLSYLRAFSVASVLEKTMQTMYLRGIFAPNALYHCISSQEINTRQDGCRSTSISASDWLPFRDQSRNFFFTALWKLKTVERHFYVFIFMDCGNCDYILCMFLEKIAILLAVLAGCLFCLQLRKSTNQITRSNVTLWFSRQGVLGKQHRGEVMIWLRKRFVMCTSFAVGWQICHQYRKFYIFCFCNYAKMQSESDSDNEFFDASEKLNLSGSFTSNSR